MIHTISAHYPLPRKSPIFPMVYMV